MYFMGTEHRWIKFVNKSTGKLAEEVKFWVCVEEVSCSNLRRNSSNSD
jgi:hypothetical protein